MWWRIHSSSWKKVGATTSVDECLWEAIIIDTPILLISAPPKKEFEFARVVQERRQQFTFPLITSSYTLRNVGGLGVVLYSSYNNPIIIPVKRQIIPSVWSSGWWHIAKLSTRQISECARLTFGVRVWVKSVGSEYRKHFSSGIKTWGAALYIYVEERCLCSRWHKLMMLIINWRRLSEWNGFGWKLASYYNGFLNASNIFNKN